MDGWMNGWLNGWMDGWMDGLTAFFKCYSFIQGCVIHVRHGCFAEQSVFYPFGNKRNGMFNLFSEKMKHVTYVCLFSLQSAAKAATWENVF